MIRKTLACVLLATLLHAAVLLFGGAVKFLFVKHTDAPEEETREVEVVEEKKEEKPEEKKQVEKVAKAEEEPLPDTSVIEAMEQAQDQPQALAQVSLADLESAIGGAGGAGGGGFNLASGGIVGGTGAPGGSGGVDAIMGGGAGLTKPRVISSPSPEFPPAILRKGGSVSLLVFVSETGKVLKVTVESSSEPALEQPAIEAIRRWLFEPATYQGKKVLGKIRQVIRLAPGNR